MIKKTLKFLLYALILLIVVLLINTFRFKSKQLTDITTLTYKADSCAISNLSNAIKFKTISYDKTELSDTTQQFTLFTGFLHQQYPLVDSLLTVKKINENSLLYKWQGTNTSLKPIILIAHMDVVPAHDGLSDWNEGPFSGAVKNGYIWGRGAQDDKISVISILEAVNSLLKENYKPERTIYIGFGHDEEVGGLNGAKKIAEYLEKENIKAEFLLDEGLLVTQKMVPGIKNNVALIGTSEKGYISFELAIHIDGGHASMPGKQTAIGILSGAISKLEQEKSPAVVCPPVKEFFEYVGPEMPFLQKMVFANTWLFKGIVAGIFEKTNSGNALIHTTMAATIFNSGIKDNVLPAEAKATINFRIIPGETIEMIKQRITQTINDDRVTIKELGQYNNPLPVSTASSTSFKMLEKSIHETFDSTYVAPSLFIAGSDSKHYINVAENIYRFLPLIANSDDLKQIHGKNERITIDNYGKCILFYRQLIRNSSSETK